MNLVELVKVTSSEEEAEKFLRAKGILKTFDRCSFCGHQKIERIRRSFFKCYGCRKEWSIRISGEVEMDESYFGGRRKVKRGRGAKGKIPVFGILEREGRVKVEIVKDVTAETLLRETIKKVKRGSIIYTDKFKAYAGLVIYGFKHERIDKSIMFSNGKVYINGIEGFWSYAKERLLKFHGVSREYFVYYLKELEFRYNFRVNLDEIRCVCSYKIIRDYRIQSKLGGMI